MKKLLSNARKLVALALAGCLTFVVGCELTEAQLCSTAKTGGTLTMLTWFSIDNPDQSVKVVLKDVVTKVTTASVAVADGATYLDAVLPQIQEYVAKQDNLTDYQKQLINAGSVVILNGIDTFLAGNEKVKEDAELVTKVVGSFGEGCLVVLNLPDDDPQIRHCEKVYAARSMQCRDGKFVPATK